MMRNKKPWFVLVFVFIWGGCDLRPLPPPIENNTSYPVAIEPYNSTSFLMLNSAANEEYIDGSIQYYELDALGNPIFSNALSIPVHGSDLALSQDNKLLALSFDGALDDTPIWFFDYSNPKAPQQLNISALLNTTGALQAVKNLSFFEVTADPNNYYMYGSINSFSQDNGDFSNIPDRVFCLRVAKDFSFVEVLFYLSYGLNDPNSFLPKSDSLNPFVSDTQYTFGSQAPTFDEARQWLIAFPTGTMGGFNDGLNTFPGLPEDILGYFGGQGNQPPGNGFEFDYRSVSMMVVNFSEFLQGTPLDQATYFTPLGWNQNGLPYGAKTNGNVIQYPNDGNSDLNSFEFQTSFWFSQPLGFQNKGDQQRTCYAPNTTTSANQFDLESVGANGLLLAKKGINGSEDYSDNGSTGFGNEVFFITGLDLLKTNIDFISTNRPTSIENNATDFKNLAPYQIIDPYNIFVSNLNTQWPTNTITTILNPGPITPYMYSRTTGNDLFDSTFQTAVPFIGVLNFGASGLDPVENNQCLPYWVRDTYQGVGFFGLDSAWLGSSTASIAVDTSPTYANAVVDPTQLSNFSFPWVEGAQVCTDISQQQNSPIIYCVNFLTAEITKLTTQNDSVVFY